MASVFDKTPTDASHIVQKKPSPPQSAARAGLKGLDYSAGQAALSPRAQLKPMVQKNAAPPPKTNFDKVSEAGLKSADAPDSVKLPAAVDKSMQDGYKRSFPGGKSQEQGGIIVKDKDGKYVMRDAPAGDSGSMTPNYGDKKATDTLIGVGHTHPYDASEGGHKGVSFSGADLARLALVADRIAVVEAGGTQFLAARTAEFDKLLEGKNQAQKRALFNEINTHWDTKFAAGGAKGIVKAAEAATKSTCDKYHLIYYKGASGGDLSKVDTSK